MILVLGGTSDSTRICNLLNELNREYIISVTTQYGSDLVKEISKNIVIKKMDIEYMTKFIKNNNIDLVIDSTHPYAIEVSKNAVKVTDILKIEYIRYERKSILDEVEYDKLIKVRDNEEACRKALELGGKVFLSTGSKTLKYFWEKLYSKNIVVRVLPTSEVIKQCEEIGFNASNIIAMKGPFSECINEETYKFYNIDLVITKESGIEGGFLEKVNAAKNIGIPVIVIQREKIQYTKVVNKIEEISNLLMGDKI